MSYVHLLVVLVVAIDVGVLFARTSALAKKVEELQRKVARLGGEGV